VRLLWVLFARPGTSPDGRAWIKRLIVGKIKHDHEGSVVRGVIPLGTEPSACAPR
jgi:hypothetical protein